MSKISEKIEEFLTPIVEELGYEFSGKYAIADGFKGELYVEFISQNTA